MYGVWKGIKARCCCKTNKYYKRYGLRGIKVCKEWSEDFFSFWKWAIENGYKQGLTIDRINNNGDYCPQNCRWADVYQQANNKRTNILITYKGKTKTLKEWCRTLSLNYSRTLNRIRIGWDEIDALTKPQQKNRIYTIEGISKTIKEWCVLYSIDSKTVNSRLRKGWDIKKAITEPLMLDNKRYVKIGEEIKPLREWHAIYSLNYDVFYNRVKKGWNEERALITPKDLSKVRIRKC